MLYIATWFSRWQAGFLFAVFNAQGTFYRGIKQLYQDRNMEQLPSLARGVEELI